jgi:GT2 family glycosyltransferase
MGYGIVGSRIILTGSRHVQLRAGRWRRLIARGFNIGYGEPVEAPADIAAIEAAADYVSGAALYVTREYIRTVGPMDESYFLYCEEVDWCLRRGQFRIGYAHDSIVYHDHGLTLGSAAAMRERSPLSVYLDERNKLLLTRKLFPQIYPLVVAATAALLVQYLARRAPLQFRHGMAGWLAGIAGETGPPSRFAAFLNAAEAS